MSDLALDPATGDLALTGGAASLVEGDAAIAQLWAHHLTLFRGEWFLDQDLGIDYQNDVLEKGVRPNVLRAIFTAATLEVPGIAQVRDLRLALDRKTRILSVGIDALLSSGENTALSLNESIGGGG